MEQLHPSGYPWAEPARTGRLGDSGFVPGPPGDDLDGRVPVVAVGSNASPIVLSHKLGRLLRTGLPVAVSQVERLGVGHSAHVSIRGYIAAAPVRADGARTVTVGWFDEAQLAALDATERTYRRVPLPGSMPCTVDGVPVAGAEIYDSQHGVLGEAGSPLELLDQAGVRAWLAERLPALGDMLDHERLLDADLRERVRLALIEAGLTMPSGI